MDKKFLIKDLVEVRERFVKCIELSIQTMELRIQSRLTNEQVSDIILELLGLKDEISISINALK